jgi:SAM-dependent methyltransferase
MNHILSSPLPPDELIELVSGHRDRAQFAASRQPAVDAIVSLLGEVGINVADLRTILDFGCGCGRILAGWEDVLSPKAKLFGCDINADLVAFCQANIRYAEVVRANRMPPLPYPDDVFDLVYAASVYTHMTMPAMLQWTGELARILQPGGHALVTTMGSCYDKSLAELSRDGCRLLYKRGYYTHLHDVSNTWEGSNDYATFSTPFFMQRLFTGFDLLAVFPGVSHGPTHLAAHQDALIFRKR